MSVVVRMEMPQGCWCCPFGHYDWIWGDDGREKMVCFCCLDLESEEDSHYLLETEMKRPSWCPIICQLPEGHGRLVDADENFLGVIHLSGGWFANYNTTIAERLGEEDMRMVKVIVPAERSET